MYQPQSIFVRLAMDTVMFHLEKGVYSPKPIPDKIPDELTIKACCFVSLHFVNGELRGCMGTLEIQEPNLYFEIVRNARNAAFHDPRFLPLTKREFPEIEFGLDVLSAPEPMTDLKLHDPAKYGIIVNDGKYRRAVLLPDLPDITTAEKQISIVKRKAGLEDVPNSLLYFQRFTSKRFN